MTDHADGRGDRRGTTAEPSEPPPLPVRLRTRTVEYDGRPDRRTVYPAEATGVERMSTWLSADADVFVSLAASR